MRNKVLFVMILMVASIHGCTSNTYRTDFHAYLLQSDPALLQSDPRSLQFRDGRFAFSFRPVPNGVYFEIENLSGAPAFLVWDRCYFLEPGGNSSKALNIDLLEENPETRDKAIYESVLPPKGRFARFTTSALNMREFSSLRSTQISNYFLKTTYSYAELNRFYSFGRYWPEYRPLQKYSNYYDSDWHLVKVIEGTDEKGFSIISDYATVNNNMGLGLCLRLEERLYDYRFDFSLYRIEVYEISTKKSRLIGVAWKADSWRWKITE